MTENVEHDVEIAQLMFSLANKQAHFSDHTVLEIA